ncbi:hypothetical protein CFP56_031455 [Quercus suber]|uniref:Uncharacterized protein n=1 Tax=Quercus suber TaxID=58331 RepID=A0AAW0LU81_QUESU
MFRQGSGQL